MEDFPVPASLGETKRAAAKARYVGKTAANKLVSLRDSFGESRYYGVPLSRHGASRIHQRTLPTIRQFRSFSTGTGMYSRFSDWSKWTPSITRKRARARPVSRCQATAILPWRSLGSVTEP